MNVWDDPRVKSGMAVQLERRRALIAAGGKPIGWKIGFGAKPIMERLRISGPLVGFLMQSGHVASGGTISLAGWTNPVAEPEVAVHMGKDLAAGSDRATAAAAIAALGPAIEMADVATPPDDVEAAVAGNIFQRHVVFGPRDSSRAGGKAVNVARVLHALDEQVRVLAPVGGPTGELDAHDRRPRDGPDQREIGKQPRRRDQARRDADNHADDHKVPPPSVESDEKDFAYELVPVGRVSVNFTR